MAQNNFMVTSLAVALSFLAVASAISKEDCLIKCMVQYNSMQGRISDAQRQLVLTECQVSCSGLAPEIVTKAPTESKTGSESTGSRTKEECQTQCKTQAANLNSVTEVVRASVLTTCLPTCDSLPSSSTSSGSGTSKVTLAQCESSCESQNRLLKARSAYTDTFINKVYTTCKSKCLKIATTTDGGVSVDCRGWVTKLRTMYANDPQSASFLQTLENRATQACA